MHLHESILPWASNFRREWNHFLQRFSSAPQNLKALDEPVLSLQRNVFCSKREEQGVKDHKVLELLYEEAKYNMLTSRYPCEISDYIMLGGIQVHHKDQLKGDNLAKQISLRFALCRLGLRLGRTTWQFIHRRSFDRILSVSFHIIILSKNIAAPIYI